jgi:hypothetical protein
MKIRALALILVLVAAPSAGRAQEDEAFSGLRRSQPSAVR